VLVSVPRDDDGDFFEADVKRAIGFLREHCAPNGFPSFISRDPGFSSRVESPEEVFTPMLILRSLGDSGLDVPGEKQQLNRVRRAFTHQGFVHFFVDRGLLVADVDCTAVALELMRKHGVSLPFDLDRTLDAIAANLDDAGVLRVYLDPDESRKDRVDAAVCANALYLFYLFGREADVKASEQYVWDHLTRAQFLAGTRYYPSPDIFLLFLSRLLRDFERSRARFAAAVEERIRGRLGLPGSNIELSARIAAAGNVGFLAERELEELVLAQGADGSWLATPCFRFGRQQGYFGGESLSTAWGAHALMVGSGHFRRSLRAQVWQDRERVPEMQAARATRETREVAVNDRDMSRLSEQINYPFRMFELNADQVELVRDELVALSGRYQLFAERKAWDHIILTYITYCSARCPENGALRLLTHFLYMLMFLIEARSRRLSRGLVLDYAGVMTGEQARSSHPLISAARDFRPRLEQLLAATDSDASAFFHYFSLNLSSFLREAMADPSDPTDPATYLWVRLHTISNLVYIQFWKLLLGVGARTELLHAADIFRCEMLSTRIQGFANDLCSLERDARDGSPNIVFVVARHEGIPHGLALRTVRRWHDDTVTEYVDANRRARKAAPPGPVTDYLEFIESCTAGNLQSLRSLAARYA
jgi:Terpene synthase family 2, C-terminal metal binding